MGPTKYGFFFVFSIYLKRKIKVFDIFILFPSIFHEYERKKSMKFESGPYHMSSQMALRFVCFDEYRKRSYKSKKCRWKKRERLIKNLSGEAFDGFFSTRRATLSPSSFFIPLIWRLLRTSYACKHLFLPTFTSHNHNSSNHILI